ncbi:MAG: phage shock protein A [Bradymonadia bacterium]|jgi:phage shock protein A
MTILDRLQRLARAELNSLRQSSQGADDVRDTVRDAKRAAGDLRVEQRKLHRDIQNLLDASQRWEDRAVLALRKNDETLAHDALGKKQQVDEQLDERRAAFDRVSMQLADMRSSLEALHLRVQAGSERRHADASARTESGARGYPSYNPPERATEQGDFPSLDAHLAHFRDMEARIEENESWSRAEDELDLDGSAATNELNDRFRTLESGASLDALKSQATESTTPEGSGSRRPPPVERNDTRLGEAAEPGPTDDDALAKLRARMNRD